ncbi:MAG: FkbM family methyltransferase [Thermoanaerobaculaceae bacterium]
MRRFIRPGMTAVDVGAHVGFYTLLFARLVAPGGRVVAVEPAPANLDLLRRNLSPAPPVPVEVLPVAAGAEDCERTLQLSDSSDTHSFFQHPLVGITQAVLVPQRRLDHLLPAPPDVVKVDVEGAELEAFEGLEGVMTQDSPRAILVEVNPACLTAAGASASALVGWLDRHGFEELELIDELAGVVHRGADARRAALALERPTDWFANLLAARR